MTTEQLDLPGVIHIIPDMKVDDRGFFCRTFCTEEFADSIPAFKPVQINLSFNKHPHTLRGMHFQKTPNEEAKIVQCLQGSLFDVAVDLRPDSSHFMQWIGCNLTSSAKDMLYIPPGFAHGFLTLESNTLIQYFMSTFYVASAATGIRYDDPTIGIKWPSEPHVISEKDTKWDLI